MGEYTVRKLSQHRLHGTIRKMTLLFPISLKVSLGLFFLSTTSTPVEVTALFTGT